MASIFTASVFMVAWSGEANDCVSQGLTSVQDPALLLPHPLILPVLSCPVLLSLFDLCPLLTSWFFISQPTP